MKSSLPSDPCLRRASHSDISHAVPHSIPAALAEWRPGNTSYWAVQGANFECFRKSIFNPTQQLREAEAIEQPEQSFAQPWEGLRAKSLLQAHGTFPAALQHANTCPVAGGQQSDPVLADCKDALEETIGGSPNEPDQDQHVHVSTQQLHQCCLPTSVGPADAPGLQDVRSLSSGSIQPGHVQTKECETAVQRDVEQHGPETFKTQFSNMLGSLSTRKLRTLTSKGNAASRQTSSRSAPAINSKSINAVNRNHKGSTIWEDNGIQASEHLVHERPSITDVLPNAMGTAQHEYADTGAGASGFPTSLPISASLKLSPLASTPANIAEFYNTELLGNQRHSPVASSGRNSHASKFMEKVFGTAYVDNIATRSPSLNHTMDRPEAKHGSYGTYGGHGSAGLTTDISSRPVNEYFAEILQKSVTCCGICLPGQAKVHHHADAEPGPESAPSITRSKALRRNRFPQPPVPQAWLHPYCRSREWSDMLVCIVVFIRCISAPLLVGFQRLPSEARSLGIELTGDIILMLDCIINLNSGFDDGGLIVMARTSSRRQYARHWLAIDLLSSLPYCLLPITLARESDSVQYLARLPQLLVLLSLARLLRNTSKWQDTWRWNLSLVRLLKLLLGSMLVTHLYACMSFFVQRQLGFPDNGWVMQVELEHRDTTYQYVYTLLRAASVVMGGNIDLSSLSSPLEIVVTLLAFITGVMVYAITVGVMSSIVQSLDKSGSAYSEKLQLWKDFCRHRQLPCELRQRVLAQLSVRYSNKRVLDEARLLMELPTALRADVQCHLCSELVACVPILQAAAPIVMRAIVGRLTREALNPGDAVFRAGDIADAMFFILKGTVKILDSEGNTLTLLSRGSHFGEMGLLASLDGDVGVRSADADAAGNTPVELYKLRCSDFQVLARYYPEVVDFLREVAAVRVAYNNTLSSGQQPMSR